MQSITELEFQAEVIESSKKLPVLVDFGTAWCAPCRAMAPAVEQIATELAGKLKVVGIDSETQTGITEAYHIFGMPTFIVFKGGAEVARVTGAMPKAKLLAFVNGAI